MKTRLGALAVCVALLAACHGGAAKENDALRARVQELEAKVATLEADNGRLKEQIRLLTQAADSLSGAMKVQQSLGTIPTAAPTATPSASPAK